MSTCCDKNPLQRSGVNQQQRLLPGLQPGYVLVDEREYADWIFFASEFSRYLKFYETTGSANGNWNAFFNTDISAILGTIAVQNVDAYRRSIKERFDFLRDDDNKLNLVGLKQKLNELFSAILTLSQALDHYIKKLPDKDLDGVKDFVFKGNLVNQVQTKLSPALKRLLAYYKAINGLGGTPDFLELSDMSGWKALNTQVESVDVIVTGTGLTNKWWSGGATDWNDYVTNKISADASIFGPAIWSDYQRINHAVNHNLFSSIFDLYLQTYSKIVQDAENTLLQTLESWDAHPAHYALFLSFLKLFRFAQASINTITQRHLDFYYKEILRLTPKEAEPNHAHVLIELAKQADQHALKQATEFKAGKDSIGKEVLYELDRETTFNKAKVTSLRSVYAGDPAGKDDQLVSGILTVNNTDRLFASPVANSDDGNGAELKSPNKEWHPYVSKKFNEGVLSDIAMPDAQVGFAIASHYLYMTEGERKVTLRIATNNNFLLDAFAVDCYLTTEKGWYLVPGVTLTADVEFVNLSFLIPGTAPAITNYKTDVHGGTYNLAVPVLKIYLRNIDGTDRYRYEDFKALTLNEIVLKVEVGLLTNGYSQQGLKQLLLSNDFGPIDASKPFMPFGPQPKRDASLVIGNKEVFSKQDAEISLNIEWAGLPASAYDIDYGSDAPFYPKVRANFLTGGIWQGNAENGDIPANIDIFNDINPKVVALSAQLIPTLTSKDYQQNYTNYDSASKEGFLRLALNGDFGHKDYLAAQIVYLVRKAKYPDDATIVPPIEPYTPLIQSLYLSYSAQTTINITHNDKTEFDNRDIQFFHIYPFGEAEVHRYLGYTNLFLLPQFTHTEVSARVDHIGEFYIGLEHLHGQQSVNILFQVMEGSSDPLVAKPDHHIHWSFLGNNQWLDFKKQEISDATRDLIQSGIISFTIPAEATTANTILPFGYIWLRGAVAEAAGAVCKLITVDAQAAVVTFEPNNNAADFLDNALPASAISKLKQPDSSIKKTTQPYSSFGGRVKESNEAFYTRVSERLRHKARAITIWDYEHLVLEAFPSIHRVKCLNHTKFDKKNGTNDMEYNEVLPGYVTVITIPDLQNRNDSNPLRPYTNQNVLSEIEDYLKKRISCHVKLRVKNPRFEEVWVSFRLKLLKGFDDFTFYSNQLKQEITQFLTPWAYNSDVDIQFGGQIQKSVLIDFIEERPYVDYILDMTMGHNSNPDHEVTSSCDEDDTPEISNNIEVAEASTARSILVSVPASKHDITEITVDDEAEITDCPATLTVNTNIIITNTVNIVF